MHAYMCVWWYRVWTRGLILARQMLYHSNHILNLFCFNYFFGGSYILPRVHFGPWSSYLCLTHSLDCKCTPPCPDNWLRWGFVNFLPGLASSHDSSNLPSSWNYRYRYATIPGLIYSFNEHIFKLCLLYVKINNLIFWSFKSFLSKNSLISYSGSRYQEDHSLKLG
jgi:hypothetical protein